MPPKGFGGDRKALELGREHTLGFCSYVWGGEECRPALARRGTERRSRWSLFPASAGGHLSPALSMICPRKKEQENGFVSLLFYCAAPGSSLTRRVGLCPTPCKGSALDPQAFGKGLTETFNALRVLIYSFVRSRRITIYFPALRCLRRSWVQGHAPAILSAGLLPGLPSPRASRG